MQNYKTSPKGPHLTRVTPLLTRVRHPSSYSSKPYVVTRVRQPTSHSSKPLRSLEWDESPLTRVSKALTRVRHDPDEPRNRVARFNRPKSIPNTHIDSKQSPEHESRVKTNKTTRNHPRSTKNEANPNSTNASSKTMIQSLNHVPIASHNSELTTLSNHSPRIIPKMQTQNAISA